MPALERGRRWKVGERAEAQGSVVGHEGSRSHWSSGVNHRADERDQHPNSGAALRGRKAWRLGDLWSFKNSVSGWSFGGGQAPLRVVPAVIMQTDLPGTGRGSLWLQLFARFLCYWKWNWFWCFLFQMVEMVCLHVISLMEALQECNSTIFVKVGKSYDFCR